MKRPKSDIPEGVIEVEIRENSQAGQFVYFRVVECILDGEVVGQRAYDEDGNLMVETPIKNSQVHGRKYIWNETAQAME